MSCCGQKRNENLQQEQHQAAGPVYNYTPKMGEDVQFEYTGKTALTVNGSITGKRYRFEHTGSKLAIDYRDAAGMTGIPVLRKVK